MNTTDDPLGGPNAPHTYEPSEGKPPVAASSTGYTATNNHLTLKWGTLKAWDFEGNETAKQLLKRYAEIGASFSAMMQRDTPEQKEIICKLIDLTPGEIHLDWDDKWVSKDEAKRYVMEYGKAV